MCKISNNTFLNSQKFEICPESGMGVPVIMKGKDVISEERRKSIR